MKSGKSGQQIARQIYNYTERFPSITAMKVLLIDQFGDQVPDNLDFSLGYYEGKANKRRWLCCKEDLAAMYKSLNKKEEITLWCESNSLKRKTQDDIPASKRQAREDEIDATYRSLKEKHSEAYESPKLRLWARMITNGCARRC